MGPAQELTLPDQQTPRAVGEEEAFVGIKNNGVGHFDSGKFFPAFFTN